MSASHSKAPAPGAIWTALALATAAIYSQPACAQGTYSSAGREPDPLPAFAAAYSPGQTVVAILPVNDEQAAVKGNLQQRFVLKAQQELSMRFAERGFAITDDRAVIGYLDQQKIDMSDEDNWNKRTLYDIGKGVNANLVVFLDIVKTESRWHGATLLIGGKREGDANLKMWLVDAQKQEPILSAATAAAKSDASNTSVLLGGPLLDARGGSEFTVRAVGNGVRELLKPFLAAYKVDHSPNRPRIAVNPAPAQAPAAPAAPPAAAPTPAPPAPSTFVFAMKSGAKFYGWIADQDLADGLIKITNDLGSNWVHTDQIVSQTPMDMAKQ